MRPDRILALAGLPAAPAERLSGGDMGEVWRCGDLVVKTHPRPPAGLFPAEARSLAALAAAGAPVPRVHWVGEPGLVIDHIPAGPSDPVALGEAIARLHTPTLPRYGADDPVFLGRFALPAGTSTAWSEVWVDLRMRPLLRATWTALGDLGPRVERVLTDFEPPLEGPRQLHGDLWAGNVVHGHRGPFLIDPSAWAGERAVDLAMMDLFGGFGGATAAAYEALAPVPSDVRAAIPYYQLYYLVLHVHFFGAGYLGGVRRCCEACGA